MMGIAGEDCSVSLLEFSIEKYKKFSEEELSRKRQSKAVQLTTVGNEGHLKTQHLLHCCKRCIFFFLFINKNASVMPML